MWLETRADSLDDVTAVLCASTGGEREERLSAEWEKGRNHGNDKRTALRPDLSWLVPRCV